MHFSRLLGAASALTLLLGAPLGAQGPAGLLPTPQDTPNRQGTRGASFLHLNVGARTGAMAGAVASSVRGPMAWFLNPAGAASSEGFSMAAGRQNLYADLGLKQSYAAVSIPALGGVLGVHFNSLSSGDILRTTEANPFGERLGGTNFQWTSTVAGVGYARRLTDRLQIGAQVKFIGEGIPDAGTKWFAGDIGTQFNTGIYGLTVGGSISNVGTVGKANGALLTRVVSTTDRTNFQENRRVSFYTAGVELPIEFRLALGSDLLGSANSLFGRGSGNNTLNAEIAVNEATDFTTQYAIAAEYGYKNRFFVRGGQRLYNDDRNRGTTTPIGLSGGFGLRLPLKGRDVRFDYSYESAGALQNIQIFSFEVGR
ncbi:PorV/PorQ family protein [Gemmatimonas sp.]|uniref:PorV/PorQ family protein n=1 Tax=Gemmatimonas sp. TaxID=1962908 RepID=UPI00333E23D8